MEILEVQHLTVTLGHKCLLEDIHFKLSSGEWLTVLGPSGAGKTTLLKALCGLQISEGAVIFNREHIENLDVSQRPLKLVFSTPSLFELASVHDNIALGLHKRHTETEIEELVSNIAKTLHIEGLLKRNCRKLSQGEKQRVVLARALVQKPSVLLLDEPFHGLDTPLRKTLQKEIHKICKEASITVIEVSHEQKDALRLCDKAMLLKDGTCIEFGNPEQVLHSSNLFTAQFLAEDFTSFMKCSVTDHRITIFQETLNFLGENTAVTISVPLEAVYLDKYGNCIGTVSQVYREKEGFILEVREKEDMVFMYSAEYIPEGENVRFSLLVEGIHIYA